MGSPLGRINNRIGNGHLLSKIGASTKKYLWELEEEEEKKKEQEISFWSSPDNTFPDDTER